MGRTINILIILSFVLLLGACQSTNAPRPEAAKKSRVVVKKFRGDPNYLFKTHRAHIAVLRKYAKCLGRSGNRQKVLQAIRTKNSGTASRLQAQCLNNRDRLILQSPPTEDIDETDEDDSETFYNSLSWGVGPSAAAIWGVSYDGGFIFDLDGKGPLRIYYSSATGKGLQLNLGVDLFVFNLYRASVISGESKSTAIVSSAEAGISATWAAIWARNSSADDDFQGLMLALGAGLGFNAVSTYDVTTNILRANCDNVKAKIINETGGKVKIVGVDYHDYVEGKWHYPFTFHKELADNGVIRIRNNLDKMYDEKTQFRIRYHKKETSFWQPWSQKEFRDWSRKTLCEKNGTIDVFLRN